MGKDRGQEVLSVVTTLGSLADAQRLARLMLEQRLAACVQIEPGLHSFYRWEGRLCEETEVRMTIKTGAGEAPALLAFFEQHHPYQLPQFLTSRMGASPAYGQWVQAEVTDTPEG